MAERRYMQRTVDLFQSYVCQKAMIAMYKGKPIELWARDRNIPVPWQELQEVTNALPPLSDAIKSELPSDAETNVFSQGSGSRSSSPKWQTEQGSTRASSTERGEDAEKGSVKTAGGEEGDETATQGSESGYESAYTHFSS